ncbi:MAG: epoxyqueuosine reductase QueH [Deltaproteobacteria bacterium]|nr:epoxyqueuosine reductase QueH [Deltaproteobacteria bacterium]
MTTPRILVHICCGPCSIMPLKKMLGSSAEVWGFFHNPNIHPLSEFRKRLAAVKTLAAFLELDVIYDEEYRPVAFVQGVRAHTGVLKGTPPQGRRCGYCYEARLEATARVAKERGFEGFTSSLLYSHSQNHEAIKKAGFELADRYGVAFFYEDFRSMWNAGIAESKALGLYRQRYCGCAYSRIERDSKKKTIKTAS